MTEETVQTTSRQWSQGGREWFIVEGDAGAITFYTYDLGRGREPGDLGYHDAADKTDDIRFSADCEFNPTRDGCRYSGFTSQGMLDVLVTEGPLAVLERLNAIYSKTYAEEAA